MRHVLMTDRAPGVVFEMHYTRRQGALLWLGRRIYIAGGMLIWLGSRVCACGMRLCTTSPVTTWTRPNTPWKPDA